MGWLLLLLMGAARFELLPAAAAPFVDPLLAGDWWIFWLVVAIAWQRGFFPGSEGWWLRQAFRELDKLQRRLVGLKPSLRSQLLDLRDYASPLVIAVCAARCYGWW